MRILSNNSNHSTKTKQKVNLQIVLEDGNEPLHLTFRNMAFLSGCLFPFIMACASLITVGRTEGNPASYLKLSGIALLYGFLFWVGVETGKTNPHVLARAFADAPVLFLVAFSFLYTLYVSKVIVTTVTEADFPALPPLHLVGMIVPFFVFENVEYETYKLGLLVYTVVIVLHYFHFVVGVSRQISQHLNIKVFSLGPAKP